MRTLIIIATENLKKAIKIIIKDISIKFILSNEKKQKKTKKQNKKTKQNDNLNLEILEKMIIFVKKLFLIVFKEF